MLLNLLMNEHFHALKSRFLLDISTLIYASVPMRILTVCSSCCGVMNACLFVTVNAY